MSHEAEEIDFLADSRGQIPRINRPVVSSSHTISQYSAIIDAPDKLYGLNNVREMDTTGEDSQQSNQMRSHG
jgi:hypothetical protein